MWSTEVFYNEILLYYSSFPPFPKSYNLAKKVVFRNLLHQSFSESPILSHRSKNTYYYALKVTSLLPLCWLLKEEAELLAMKQVNSLYEPYTKFRL